MGIQNEIEKAKELLKFDEKEIAISDIVSEANGEKPTIKIASITRDNVILAEAVYQIMYGRYDLGIDKAQRKRICDIEKSFLNDDELDEEKIKGLREQLNKIKDKNRREAPAPSSYWFREIKVCKEKDSKHFRFLLIGACHAVNRENSTHLKNNDLKEIVNWIYNNINTPQELAASLKDRKQGDKMISDLRKIDGISDNYSFITKFCHYASFNIFDDKHRDNYSIYDKILSDNIPYYYYHYVKKDEEISYDKIRKMRKCLQNNGNTKREKQCENRYNYYTKKIDEIIKASHTGISRNGFDHLLWIYHRQ